MDENLEEAMWEFLYNLESKIEEILLDTNIDKGLFDELHGVLIELRELLEPPAAGAN